MTDADRRAEPLTRGFRPEDADAVRAILERCIDAGDLPGHTRMYVAHIVERAAALPDSTLVHETDGDVAGFAMPDRALLIVHPDRRRCGIGTCLLEAIAARAAERGDTELLLFSYGHAASEAFLRRFGFAYRTSYWHMRQAAEASVPPPVFPSDVAPRRVRPGADDAAFAALANGAFADHPTPIVFHEEVVRSVHARPDFDPASTLLLAPRDEPDRLIAFCRTYEEPAAGGTSGGIGSLGMLPAWRGRGLGRELLRWGILRLRGRGVASIALSVDADNPTALQLYERHGFRPEVEWPIWRRRV